MATENNNILIGKSTNQMAMFNSYAKLAEGNHGWGPHIHGLYIDHILNYILS